jgi:hypothetical protein
MTSAERIPVVRPASSRKDVRQAGALLTLGGVEKIAKDQRDEPGSIQLLIRDDEAVGALVHKRHEWRLGEARLRVAYLWECTGESGEGAFRRTGDRGDFDDLVEGWCLHLREAGYHLAFTHGEMALWPVHGFYPTFYHPRVYIPTAKALKLRAIYKVRAIKTTDARPMMQMMERNRDLRPRVFATGVPHFHHYAVEGPKRRIYGYFSMGVSDGGNGVPPVFIPEVEVVNRSAATTILAHVAPFARDKGVRAIHFPLAAAHPFSGVCLDLGGYFQLRGTTRDLTLDEEMIRIVDVRRLLEALKDDLAERLGTEGFGDVEKDFTLDVEGERVPIRLSGGRLECVDSVDSDAEVQIARWALTQMVMGYRTADELPGGVLTPAGAIDLFAALFPKTWPLSLCDHDLWDPSLRDPDKYCPEAMAQIRKLRYTF